MRKLNNELLECIAKLETSQTIVQVCDLNAYIKYIDSSGQDIEEKIYCIISENKLTHKEYVRYGNWTQVQSILNSYKYAKEVLKND